MFPKKGENIPEIRFPEFSDAWKQRELKEVVNFSRGQGLPWADVDDLNGQFECILYGNLYTDYGTIIQNIKHKTNTDLKVKSKGNEVLIPGSDTTPTGLARALFLEKENVILGGDINILSVKHDDGPFLAYELNKLKKELIIRIKGTTVKHLQNNDLKDIVVSLPSLEEQRKISSLFSRLDNTITLQQRKLNSLQKLKKGLLQKMFPKNGENIPEIRFPEFSDAWKQRKFGEFVERKSDSALSSTSIPSVEYENVESETGVLKKDIYVKTEFKKGVLFSDKDVLYGKLRPYLHNWLAPSFTGVAVGDWWVLSPKNCSKDFLYRLLQTLTFDEIANQTSGTKMPRADWNLVSSTAFYIPSSIEEQAKIGSLFNRIDSTITLQQRKLESLQKLKKGLLQQMFI